MKPCFFVIFLSSIFLLAACQRATPAPVTAALDEEFTFESGQSATITHTGLVLTFDRVPFDERCPSELECAASGPVTVLLKVQLADGTVNDLTLQTFTGYNGRSPEGPFEGISDRVLMGEHGIRVKGVAPYPVKSSDEIKDTQYQVTLVVSRP